MPQRPSEGARSSAHSSNGPTELERAIKACRSAFATCAVFSLVINVLMLASPLYMLQVYDRVLTTGRVETQAMHMLPALTERWAAVNRTVLDGLRRSGDVGGFVLATTKFVRFFVQVAILGVGAWLVVNSQLTAGAMIAGSILLGRALAPVELVISMWRNFMAARFSYDRLRNAIEDHPPPF